MISEADYTSRDATALAGLVRNREVSPQELLDAAIARIERLNPRINAVVERLYDAARRDIADGLPDGPFAGVPFLVKDLHTLVKCSRLSHGCRYFAGHVSSHDSSIVTKARAAGLVIAGQQRRDIDQAPDPVRQALGCLSHDRAARTVPDQDDVAQAGCCHGFDNMVDTVLEGDRDGRAVSAPGKRRGEGRVSCGVQVLFHETPGIAVVP